jgi:pyridoxal phosphate enzyme (YggS family)
MFNILKYKEIEEKINNFNRKSKIIAISKNHSQDKVDEAISFGIKIFGENRVQEAKKKFEKILENDRSIELHLTGPLQTNKVKHALDIFHVFHTLDREKLLKELSKFPEKIKDKKFFIQVNSGKEDSKSGIYPEKVKEFLNTCHSYGVKNIMGLMCIPPINESPETHFELVSKLSHSIGLSGTSLGMSSDYEKALSFNPLYIRLGTILFGKR